jgi:hypothetical protein
MMPTAPRAGSRKRAATGRGRRSKPTAIRHASAGTAIRAKRGDAVGVSSESAQYRAIGTTTIAARTGRARPSRRPNSPASPTAVSSQNGTYAHQAQRKPQPDSYQKAL